MTSFRRAVVPAGVATLLLIAACGGAGHGSPPGSKPPVVIASGITAPGIKPPGNRAVSQAARWWHPMASGPNQGPEFQWMLDHPLDVHNDADMGGGGPTVYDIDAIINPASTVHNLHRLHDKAICYVEVGAAGDYYSAAAEGITVTYFAQLKAAGDLGRSVPGYPESYLDINAASTLRIVESMIRQQCYAKGFDAVEPDIDDSYTDATGLPITEADNIRYDKTLGAYVHSLGLAWGQKNGDADPQFSAALEPYTDFLLDEECNYYRTCSIVTPPYVNAKKMVLNIEYTSDWGSDAATDLGRFCAFDSTHHIDGTLFTKSLTGSRQSCR